MRHGICILPEFPWSEAEALWRRAEEMGFDHAWTYDHLVFGGMPDSPWHSTVATLTAAAMVTERIGLGTLVTSPNFRHPVALARDVMTLEDISGGRMLLGVGAGGDVDSQILGEELTRGQRSRRFREFVPLLDRCLREDHVSHDGTFYRAVDARTHLPTATPLLVAADGPRAMALAARYGTGWITTGPSSGPWPERRTDERWWQGLAQASARLTEAEQAAAEQTSSDPTSADQAPSEQAPTEQAPSVQAPSVQAPSDQAPTSPRPPLDRYLSLDSSGPDVQRSVTFLTEQVGRAEELGFTDVILHWPRPEPPYTGDLRVLEDYLASLR